MGLKKIADLPEGLKRGCPHREHDPPKHIVLDSGIYMHTCPGCGAVQTFIVAKPTW